MGVERRSVMGIVVVVVVASVDEVGSWEEVG